MHCNFFPIFVCFYLWHLLTSLTCSRMIHCWAAVNGEQRDERVCKSRRAQRLEFEIRQRYLRVYAELCLPVRDGNILMDVLMATDEGRIFPCASDGASDCDRDRERGELKQSTECCLPCSYLHHSFRYTVCLCSCFAFGPSHTNLAVAGEINF